MPEPLDSLHSLDSLAEHAVRHARLEPAAVLRRRADRRRTRRRVSGSALAVVVVASVAVGVSALGGDDRAGRPPTADTPTVVETTPSETAPRPLATPTDAPVLDGSRQLVLLPTGTGTVVSLRESGNDPEPRFEVSATGRLSPLADLVPVPVSPGADSFQLKTGSVVVGGEALCLAVPEHDGPGVAAVWYFTVRACDTSDDGTLWRLQPRPTVDGFTTFAVVNGSGAHLRVFDDGGDTFHVADTGPASIPALD